MLPVDVADKVFSVSIARGSGIEVQVHRLRSHLLVAFEELCMRAVSLFFVDSREVQIFDSLYLKAARGATLGPLGMLGPIEGPKIGLVIVHILERVDLLRGMHWVRASLPKNFS